MPERIVDTHQHLWDLSRFRLPWIGKGTVLDHSYRMDEYLQATAGLHVVKTVYMEVAVEASQREAEAEYVLDLCKRPGNPMAGTVLGGDPADPSFKAYLARFKVNPYVKGIRCGLPAAASRGELPSAFVQGVRLLGESGLRFDLLGQVPFQPAIRLVDACPQTRFILDHCGNPNVQEPNRSAWERDIAELAKRPHVVCKISGFVGSARPGQWTPHDLEPIINHVLKEFGPDRVVFGGDWPVCLKTATFKQWVEALAWIVRHRKSEDRRKLFHDNAVRIYELS
jgi:L-fuconolactonase